MVFDKSQVAMYFSRSPLPWCENEAEFNRTTCYKHQGIYGYSKELLNAAQDLQPSDLEKSERLEQLRFLHNKKSIFVHLAEHEAIGVDLPSDIALVERLLRKEN